MINMDQIGEMLEQIVVANEVIIFWGHNLRLTTLLFQDLFGFFRAGSSFCKSNMDKTRANGMKRHAMYSTYQQLY